MHNRTTQKLYERELRHDALRPLQQEYYEAKAFCRTIPSAEELRAIKAGEKLSARIRRKMKFIRREVWFQAMREKRNAQATA